MEIGRFVSALDVEAAAPITGWRVWWLYPAHRLLSLVVNVPWLPGEPMSETLPLLLRYGVGVHAFRDMQYATAAANYFRNAPGIRRMTADGVVVGAVSMSGKVMEHIRGYRAEHAEITELLSACTLRGTPLDITPIRERYLPQPD